MTQQLGLALCLFVLGCTCAAASGSPKALTPEELCAASPIDQRVAINTTSFVACYKKQVWSLGSCPRGLRFRQRSQTCVANRGVRLVPGPRRDATATASPSIFLYAWAGNDNPGPDCRDAVVVIDGTPESATFGKILNVAYTPTWGNEPHHVGLSNNTFLAVGGIQSYLKGQPDIYIFNTSQPDDPTLVTTVDPPLSAVTDSFAGQADGGFWVSQMGDATGGTPGRLVRLSGNFSVVKEFPDNPPPGFNPHGFSIDATRQRIVTADYLELKSTITGGPGIDPKFVGGGTFKYRSTVRVWQLPQFELVGEFDAGDVESDGFMTVQPVGSSGIFVSGSGRGTLYALNVSDTSEVRPAHFIGDKTSSCVMIPLAFSAGKRFFVTVLGLNLVQLVDTSNPLRWQTLQEIYLPRNTYPHAISATRNGTLIAVSTYYLNQVYNDGQSIGTLQQLGSRKVYFFDVLDGGNAIRFNRRVPVVNVKREVNVFRGECGTAPKCGGWRPHGMVFKSVSSPVPVTPRGSTCPK